LYDYITENDLSISSEYDNLGRNTQKHKLTMFAEDCDSDNTLVKTLTQ